MIKSTLQGLQGLLTLIARLVFHASLPLLQFTRSATSIPSALLKDKDKLFFFIGI